ncbi:hypothetical protein [Gallibacterium genomosp. 3]|uniref:Chalcone isomerase domain-containing protein n=1 Tax=Gallibacterium genomosp. 3 TaxID=505345 RepID=A0A1A7QBG4_9PAST|nr:hypothetical protein [Gallibacterium genomosp. 3]OBX11514.1 hypothetical protein QV07_01405 [Gallibacterium genomosp. 3]
MKFFSFCLSLLLLLYTPFSSADWNQVGKAEYNWGPFHIYTVSLFTENGAYSSEQRPLMLRIKFAKPVEGKNFAVSMVKEMALDQMKPEEVDQLRKRLIKNFSDFKPDDVLNYIALEKDGYFVLNDTILSEHFDKAFNHQFISIWLDSESSFKQLQPRLLGEDKEKQTEMAKTDVAKKADPTAPTAISTAAAEVAQEAKADAQQDNQDQAKPQSAHITLGEKMPAQMILVEKNTEQSEPQATTVAQTEEQATNTQKMTNTDKSSEENKETSPSENASNGKTEQSVTHVENKAVPPMQQQTNKPTEAETTPSDKSASNSKDSQENASQETNKATQSTANQDTATEADKAQQQKEDKSEEPKVDPEQPIEPPVEVDPIMPYQKHYCC